MQELATAPRGRLEANAGYVPDRLTCQPDGCAWPQVLGGEGVKREGVAILDRVAGFVDEEDSQ